MSNKQDFKISRFKNTKTNMCYTDNSQIQYSNISDIDKSDVVSRFKISRFQNFRYRSIFSRISRFQGWIYLLTWHSSCLGLNVHRRRLAVIFGQRQVYMAYRFVIAAYGFNATIDPEALTLIFVHTFHRSWHLEANNLLTTFCGQVS